MGTFFTDIIEISVIEAHLLLIKSIHGLRFAKGSVS